MEGAEHPTIRWCSVGGRLCRNIRIDFEKSFCYVSIMYSSFFSSSDTISLSIRNQRKPNKWSVTQGLSIKHPECAKDILHGTSIQRQIQHIAIVLGNDTCCWFEIGVTRLRLTCCSSLVVFSCRFRYPNMLYFCFANVIITLPRRAQLAVFDLLRNKSKNTIVEMHASPGQDYAPKVFGTLRSKTQIYNQTILQKLIATQCQNHNIPKGLPNE